MPVVPALQSAHRTAPSRSTLITRSGSSTPPLTLQTSALTAGAIHTFSFGAAASSMIGQCGQIASAPEQVNKIWRRTRSARRVAASSHAHPSRSIESPPLTSTSASRSLPRCTRAVQGVLRGGDMRRPYSPSPCTSGTAPDTSVSLCPSPRALRSIPILSLRTSGGPPRSC